ncbi:hypothetical protein [Cellvibrio sp. PSBB023]|uniref:hypothetical protein n=1 Tax=Cellvibrio sp. PSBB023 TaxID=1945512 RepID=UPI00098EAA40|nr:hypothetical protein [Cellvibrio sp. PSBB023]AQT60502.1 hypothetical protein B0D95_10675 [Cellvibrio sp. PSBB023]
MYSRSIYRLTYYYARKGLRLHPLSYCSSPEPKAEPLAVPNYTSLDNVVNRGRNFALSSGLSGKSRAD